MERKGAAEPRARQCGMSLVEMVVALAVMAIALAITYESFQFISGYNAQYVALDDAQAQMTDMLTQARKHFAARNTTVAASYAVDECIGGDGVSSCRILKLTTKSGTVMFQTACTASGVPGGLTVYDFSQVGKKCIPVTACPVGKVPTVTMSLPGGSSRTLPMWGKGISRSTAAMAMCVSLSLSPTGGVTNIQLDTAAAVIGPKHNVVIAKRSLVLPIAGIYSDRVQWAP